MFVFKRWKDFCRKLQKLQLSGLTCREALSSESRNFYILKHDVESHVEKALRMARIEYEAGITGSYYVQSDLLRDKSNVDLLQKIQGLGHEVSYHHDVMDSNLGRIDAAIDDFRKNIRIFTDNGFAVNTVCQHGNPIVERKGYASNRDFFRNPIVQDEFQTVTDVMVGFSKRMGKPYTYISDAGRSWKIISDPENNDQGENHDKDIMLGDLNQALDALLGNGIVIVSTHPHRWHSHAIIDILYDCRFRAARAAAKRLAHIRCFKAVFSRYYYLARRI